MKKKQEARAAGRMACDELKGRADMKRVVIIRQASFRRSGLDTKDLLGQRCERQA